MYKIVRKMTKGSAGMVFHRCLFSLLLAALFQHPTQGQRPGANLPAPVEVEQVVEQEVRERRTFVGTVKPLRRSIVGTAVDGRVVEFLLSQEDPLNKIIRVEQGAALAQLRTGTIKLELAASQADLQLREQELKELENGARPEELAQAKARLLGAQALREYSNSKSRRARDLFRQGKAISREELDLSESDRIQGEQGYLEAKAAFEIVQKGPRKEKIEQARARLLVQQEQVNRIQDMLEKYTIRSPFAGYVVAEHTEVGQWVSKGDSIAEVIDLNTIEVEFFVPEKVVSQLSLGMSASVTINAFPEKVFTGILSRIVPQADIRSRTFPVKARLPNPQRADGSHLFHSGMLAHVAVAIGKPHLALLVHKDALVLNGPLAQVIVVDFQSGDSSVGKVRSVPVQTGVSKGNLIQVNGALRKGEYVVVLGNERLRPRQLVRVVNRSQRNQKPSIKEEK